MSIHNSGKASGYLAATNCRNVSEAMARMNIIERLLNPTPLDKAELELNDAWWITPEQRKILGNQKKTS